MRPHADVFAQQERIDRTDLASGDFARLLRRYDPVIRARCIARLRDPHAGADAAQDVQLRLFRELSDGRRYEGMPYGVVVAKVTDWTLRDHWARQKTGAEIPVEHDPADPAYVGSVDEVDDRVALEGLWDLLVGREREVARLVWGEGLSHDQVAAELAIERNNVDQALYRARKKLLKLGGTAEEMLGLG